MAEYLIQKETLTEIADAIREKTSTAGTLTPTQMAAAIAGINTGAAGEGNCFSMDITLESEPSAVGTCIAESIPYVAAHMNDPNFFLMFVSKTYERKSYYARLAMSCNRPILIGGYSLYAGYGSTITSMTLYVLTGSSAAANSDGASLVGHSRVYAAEGGSVYLNPYGSYEIFAAGEYTLVYGLIQPTEQS